ncbi:MAG: NAD(P)/FAD-dependent oxidoreductase [Bacteroidetes bacterium]|nr:NAD(P)/FAD-dependent oxidoreductase [Bacteroidota bacterium]
MLELNRYDVIIIGGSYAGLAAGMALGRALRKVLIIDSGLPCNRQTPYSHNFLTNDGKKPAEIAAIALQQVLQYRTVDFLHDEVTGVSRTENLFDIHTKSGETFKSRKLVFATGIKDIMPDIPGLAESWGIGVLHCPYCHGYEVRGLKTGVIANGEGGFEQVALIANWTDDLTLFTNGKSNLTPQQVSKLKQHKIDIVEDEIVRLEHKGGVIDNILFKDGKRVPLRIIYSRLPFRQHTDLPQLLGCELSPEGYLKVDSAQKTSVPGVFACGDNCTRMRTVANAVSMGTTTGLMVNRELIEEEF